MKQNREQLSVLSVFESITTLIWKNIEDSDAEPNYDQLQGYGQCEEMKTLKSFKNYEK